MIPAHETLKRHGKPITINGPGKTHLGQARLLGRASARVRDNRGTRGAGAVGTVRERVDVGLDLGRHLLGWDASAQCRLDHRLLPWSHLPSPIRRDSAPNCEAGGCREGSAQLIPTTSRRASICPAAMLDK